MYAWPIFFLVPTRSSFILYLTLDDFLYQDVLWQNEIRRHALLSRAFNRYRIIKHSVGDNDGMNVGAHYLHQ